MWSGEMTKIGTYGIWLVIGLEDHGMMCNEIIMAVFNGFGETRRSRAEQAGGRRVLRGLFVVKPNPILLPVSKEHFPRLKALRNGLIVEVQDQDVGSRDATGIGSVGDGSQHLRLRH